MKRRRFLTIAAASIAYPFLPTQVFSQTALQSWRGIVLGGEASILLAENDRARAKSIFKKCLDEILRLEEILSLYDSESAICKLNENGKLKAPPEDLVAILKKANEAHELTNGAFDISIQPLWKLYHETKGKPKKEELKKVLSLVNQKNIDFNDYEIEFKTPKMQISLNGIAQGYITDIVSEFLISEGYKSVLVDLGETRAIGNHPENTPWRVALRNESEIFDVVELSNKSIATTAGYGMRFEKGQHHVLNPKSGLSPAHYSSLSVIAENATIADALSTGLYCLEPEKVEGVAKKVDGLKVITA